MRRNAGLFAILSFAVSVTVAVPAQDVVAPRGRKAAAPVAPAAPVPKAESAPSAGPLATAPAPVTNAGGEGVLDFEGDLIEGQRKRPDMFMQNETQNLTLDAILYLRNDFNDFHQVEKNRRPSFFEKRK